MTSAEYFSVCLTATGLNSIIMMCYNCPALCFPQIGPLLKGDPITHFLPSTEHFSLCASHHDEKYTHIYYLGLQ